MKEKINKMYPQMKMFGEARLQSKGYNIIIEIIVFYVVFFLSSMCGGLISMIYESIAIVNDPYLVDIVNKFKNREISYDDYVDVILNISSSGWGLFFSLLGTGITTLVIFAYVHIVQKRKLSTMGFRKDGWLKEYVVGMVLGVVMFTLSVGICLATGTLTFAGMTENIPWLMIFGLFVGFLIQGMSEEVVCRGYFMVSMSRHSSAAVAAFVSSAAFSLGHLGNPNVNILPLINILLFGIFEALYIMKRGSIWGACGVHSLWNFVQGDLFGIRVSGLEKMPTIFNMESTGNALINGGGFGLEGGLAVTFVLVASIVILSLTKPKESEVMSADEIAEVEKAAARRDEEAKAKKLAKKEKAKAKKSESEDEQEEEQEEDHDNE